jgi:AmmeMemoRadiSam system protein A
MDLTADQRRILLDVARQMIRSTLDAGSRSPSSQMPVPDDPALHQPAGCFVTLHTLIGHRLRGCVGRLDSRDALLTAVRHSAVNVLDDPRFASFPVCLHELPELEIELTVILPLREAANCLDFDLLSDGIYLMVNDRAGCFLPQVAQETGWNREQLLSRLCTEKLGVSANAWQSPAAKLMKFQTVLVGPEPFVTR